MKVDSALVMATLLVTVAVGIIIKKMVKSVSPRLPGPRGLPIVGHLPFLRRDLPRQLAELAAEYGPIYMLQLGTKRCIVISSASLAKQVLRDQDTAFANRDITAAARIGSYYFNDIAYGHYGQDWRHRRKIFSSELLSNTNLKASQNLRKDQVRKAIKQIYYATPAGKPVGILEFALRINLDLLINMIWGAKIHPQQIDAISLGLMPILTDMMELLLKPNISDFFPVLAWFDFQGIAKRMKSLMRNFEDVTKDAIDERIKNPYAGVEEKEGRKDFMHTLVDHMHNHNPSSLGVVHIKAMLINTLAGGTDTSSTVIEWTMAELLKHPLVMDKVQHELSEVVGLDNIVEESHIPKLVYLDAVIKETLRIHPTGPILTPRTPSRDCTVGGFTIPKGSTVFVNVWSIHRDPVSWDDPLEFRPERFLVGEGGKCDFYGNNFNYIPFGSGRRICAGLPLAEIMVRYILASLLHSFLWRLPESMELDMSDELLLPLRKRIPLAIVPFPRLPSSDLYM